MSPVLGAIISAFFVVAVPAIVLMAVWTAVMAFRLCFPERPLPFVADPYEARRAAEERGEVVQVGLREIREDLRRRPQPTVLPYHFAHGVGSEGLPEPWLDDLWARRN